MDQSWDKKYKDHWNERYGISEFAYGKEPNLFFREWLPEFKPGTILMPADGEGRNGVFAAQLGWDVVSVDLSGEGKSKALQLAGERKVTLEYKVGDLGEFPFEKKSFDAIGLVYAHFSSQKKSLYHKQLNDYLKPGGIIILEAFGKSHLKFREADPRVGGPGELDMLYSVEEIKTDFRDYEILVLEEKEIDLSEGKYHIGKGAVIRFVGRKIANNPHRLL